jgi:hypothetical protein
VKYNVGTVLKRKPNIWDDTDRIQILDSKEGRKRWLETGGNLEVSLLGGEVWIEDLDEGVVEGINVSTLNKLYCHVQTIRGPHDL